jgi:hypothetical protein
MHASASPSNHQGSQSPPPIGQRFQPLCLGPLSLQRLGPEMHVDEIKLRFRSSSEDWRIVEAARYPITVKRSETGVQAASLASFFAGRSLQWTGFDLRRVQLVRLLILMGSIMASMCLITSIGANLPRFLLSGLYCISHFSAYRLPFCLWRTMGGVGPRFIMETYRDYKKYKQTSSFPNRPLESSELSSEYIQGSSCISHKTRTPNRSCSLQT